MAVTKEFKAIEKLLDILNPLIISSERGYAYEVEGYVITDWKKTQSEAMENLRNVLKGYIASQVSFDEHVKAYNAEEERIKAWLHELSKKKNVRHVAAAELHFNKTKYVSLVMQELRESGNR